MKNIILQFIKNSINLANYSDFFSLVSFFNDNINTIGIEILRLILEEHDLKIKKSFARKRAWDIVRINTKTIFTPLGKLTFKQTYYRNKRTKQYAYLLDQALNISKYRRLETVLQSKILELTNYLSFENTGKLVYDSENFTKQTVQKLLDKYTHADLYTINQIFTSVNYTNILNSIQEFFSKDHFNHIKDTVFKSINCKNFDFARIEYQCPHCGSRACKPVTCKTKFCPCCSKIYTENWANKLNQQMINQKHKHLLFTIPKELRSFFLKNRELLIVVSDYLNSVFKDHFWKKYKITHFGYITFFFNPHLHILITCGGFKETLQWKSVDFFPYSLFKNSWKYIVTTALKEAFPNDHKLLNIINSIWKNQIDFFIDVKETEIYNSLNALKYLGRYLARPSLAEYRITHFDGNSVTFWYEQLPEKNKVFLELPVEKFIKQLVAHIPPKGFKMIRRYGILL